MQALLQAIQQFEEKKCIQVANERIKQLKEGNLKVRPINKPIHIPSGNDKVSKVPDEWLTLNFTNGH